MAAVRLGRVASTIEAIAAEKPAPSPNSTHDPASAAAPSPEASTPMLREWSYRGPVPRGPHPRPAPPGASRSSSLPSLPGPVGRSRTPVAFAVKEDPTLTAAEAHQSQAGQPGALGGSRHPWLNAAAASAAVAATMSAVGDQIQICQQQQQQQSGCERGDGGDDPQQLQPVVATLVTNLAVGLRSGIENMVYAGVAERIEEDGEAVVGEPEHHVLPFLDPATREALSLPPPPSALPDEHGLAMPPPAQKVPPPPPPPPPPRQQQQEPQRQLVPWQQAAPPPTATQPPPGPEEPCRDLVVRDASALPSSVFEPPLEPPSLFEDQQAKHDEAAAAAGDALRDRADTSDGSLNDWVMDEYDEATFHVEDGKLVEERVPVPSVEYEELYEEAMLAERRGIGCIKRPRRLLARQQHFIEPSLEEEKERYEADSSPWGRSAQERATECESAKDEEQHPEDASTAPPSAAAVGKNGFGKARHPVLRWVQRRRKARQQKLAKREKKIAENQASICRLQEQQQHPKEEEEGEEEVPQVQSTTTASVCAEDSTRTFEDESGYNASSERSARADPTTSAPRGEKANRISKRARRSRSVPAQRRRGKSKNKGSVDGNGNSNAGGGARRPKSKSPKRMKNLKKAAKRARRKHNRASFKRSVSLDDVAEARDEDKRDYTDEEELEADPFGRLKPLPTDPRLELRSAGGRTSSAHSNGNTCPVAPIAQVIRRSCASAAVNGAAAPKPDQQHPVLALAATATARVVGGLLHHQQHLLQQQQNQKQQLPRALPLPPLANLLAAVPIPDLPTAVAQEDTKVLEEDADTGKNATAPPSPLPPPLHVPPAEVFHMLPPLPGATPADDSEIEEGQEVLSDEDNDKEDDNDDDGLVSEDAAEGVDHAIHTVLPSDTFSGICLRYKISALELRRANRFSGTNLKLAPSRLVIPLDKTKGGRVCAQDKASPEYKIHEVMAAVKGLGTSAEARAYLLMSGWDVAEAIEAAKGDLGWERDNEELRSQTLTEKEDLEDSVPLTLLPEQEAPQTAKAEVGASSDVESLLEDITRVLDELEAYPGVDAPEEGSDEVDDRADDETTAPSLAGTDISSSSSSSPDSPSAHEPRVVRHHAKMFQSLRDKGVLCSPRPPPLHERSRSRSWTAPSSVDVFPSNSPSLKATSKKELPAPDSEETTAVQEDCAVVPRAHAPLQPPARSPLKVVFVGDAVGSIPEAANAARRLASHHRRLRRRSSDLKGRTPTFEVWNGPGGGGNKAAFAHHATQSLFFAPDALYVLFWDMALDDPKTYPRGRRRGRAYSDHSSDEEDEDDLFASEEAARRADRALERRADEEVSVWVDHIMRSLERRYRNCRAGGASSRCSILPVAVAPAGADENEVRRRRNLLRSRMLRRCEEWARLGSAATPTPTVVPAPEIVFPEGTVLCMGANDASAEPLRVAVEAVAAGRRREVKPLPRPTSLLRLSDTDSVSVIVRDIVRELKHAHKVVATGHVASLVQKIVECDDAAARSAVVESLQCLSEEGEVLFFGGAHPLQESSRSVPSWAAAWTSETVTREVTGKDHNSDDCLLDQFVILSPRWLSSAISCILRPDLKREIVETRELMSSHIGYENSPKYEGIDSEAPLSSSPVIMSADVRMLWESMAFMREASDGISNGAEETSLATGPMLFEFVEKVLVRYGVFVPLGTEPGNSFFSGPLSSFDTSSKPTSSADGVQGKNSTLYLLPGLMASDPPSDIWTYKAKDSWSTTLCHSWLFRDNVPPGTMERVIGSVLRDMWLSKGLHIQGHQAENRKPATRVHQVMVWGSAFMLRLGMDVRCPQTGERSESVIELFGHLTGATDSSSGPPCVAESSMGSSMKRLTISAKGQAGDAGRKIWDGGLSLVINSVSRALEDVQGGNSIEREIICPDCLSLQHPCHASTWKADWVRSFQQKGHTHMRCGCGHNVEIDLVCGTRLKSHRNQSIQEVKPLEPPVMPVSSLLDGVVVVGLWDGKTKQIRNVGSGFVADKEKGLILTASHILFDMQSRERFGQEFFGIKEAKVVIGVIPKSSSSKGPRCTTAVFRYFAEIVAHDVRKVDACVLRITTKFEEDVGGDGEGCGDQPEVPLKNNIRAMKAEKLYQLKLTKKFELEEDVRILGYNQGGEGRLKPGLHVNRCADFARGYVCKKFKIPAHERIDTGLSVGFNPLEETVVMCPTISGHSGGPCVNSVGSVIGILSRADPADRQRCYLVPASELKKLLKKAKAKCTMSPLDLYYRT